MCGERQRLHHADPFLDVGVLVGHGDVGRGRAVGERGHALARQMRASVAPSEVIAKGLNRTVGAGLAQISDHGVPGSDQLGSVKPMILDPRLACARTISRMRECLLGGLAHRHAHVAFEPAVPGSMLTFTPPRTTPILSVKRSMTLGRALHVNAVDLVGRLVEGSLHRGSIVTARSSMAASSPAMRAAIRVALGLLCV